MPNLFLWLLEEQGLITQGLLERGDSGGRAGEGVAGVFNPHELLAPGDGVGGDKGAKSHLQVLIGLHLLAIGLRVEPREISTGFPTAGWPRKGCK
jgi:hypothetical protein